jgi:molybdopterin synthase catalytic subunit
MTEKCLQNINEQAQQRWPLLATRIIHRVGELRGQDQIVFVATASAHRHAAFDSAQFIMDYLKTNAPFWKKQNTDGCSTWVESRQIDQAALERWQE